MKWCHKYLSPLDSYCICMCKCVRVLWRHLWQQKAHILLTLFGIPQKGLKVLSCTAANQSKHLRPVCLCIDFLVMLNKHSVNAKYATSHFFLLFVIFEIIKRRMGASFYWFLFFFLFIPLHLPNFFPFMPALPTVILAHRLNNFIFASLGL